jgi:hypothetical protein
LTSSSALLKNIFYGQEISDKNRAINWLRSYFVPELGSDQIDRVYDSVLAFFGKQYPGVFGGQITAGDGLFLACMMERVRPSAMIEIGVASGYSSAFILHHAQVMGLVGDGAFLTSYDLVKKTSAGMETGSLLRSQFPQFERFWSLNCEVTSADLAHGRVAAPLINKGENVLAFIDGGHNHPWPLMDLAYLMSILDPGSWIVMQDSQMMERWIADCVIFGTTCPAPVRGVNLAVALWPGRKIIGHGICYNSAAVQLSISDAEFQSYAKEMLRYPNEIEFDHRDLVFSRRKP